MSTRAKGPSRSALPDPSKLLLTASEVAAKLGRSRTTFYVTHLDREIPWVTVGRTRLWPLADVEAWLERERERRRVQEAS